MLFKKPYPYLAVFVFSLSFFSNINSEENEPVFKMGSVVENNSPTLELVTSIFDLAFQRAGAKFEFVGCTPVNCTKYLKNGLIDSEMSRIKEYKELYPELIRVEEPLAGIPIGAYSFGDLNPVNSRQDVKDFKGNVYYQSGVVYSQYHFKDNKLQPYNNLVHGISLLKADSNSILISPKIGIMVMRNQHPNVTHGLKELGVIEMLETYSYFSPKHKEFVPKFEKALKSLKEDGTLENLMAAFRKKMANTIRP